MTTDATNTVESAALRIADDLLGLYPLAVDTTEGVRNLIALGYLYGSKAGSEDTITIIRKTLAAVSA